MNSLRTLAFTAILAFLAPAIHAQEATNTASRTAATDDAEAKYSRDIEKRATDILVLLELNDAAKSNHVHGTVVAQYRTLRSWHDANDAKLKELTKKGASPDKDAAAQAKEEMAKISASLKAVHDDYISKLSADLTPAQVEKVKDKMTYFKVKVTYDSYCEIATTLTEEQKAKILEWLKEARELAMDAGSSDEKSAIFNKYKGRINNYLSKQGVNMGQATKEWNERRKVKPEQTLEKGKN